MLTLGIAGGTGSGKTTVAKAIAKQLGHQTIKIIHQDSYYLDQTDVPFDVRVKTNYDHPSAMDMALLKEHIRKLRKGLPIEKPIYDFKIHTRVPETEPVDPVDVLIIEGIFALQDPELRELLDIKIYVETDADIRFIRRLKRDIMDRGRSLESVIQQYKEIVRAMHLQFVEPSKQFADIIIPEGGYNKVAIDILVKTIREYIRQKSKGTELSIGEPQPEPPVAMKEESSKTAGTTAS